MADDPQCSVLTLLCYLIVGLQICRYLYGLLVINYLAPKLGFKTVNFKSMGNWAVITGATDGIGKAYAEELAKKKINIFLISRTQSKLDEVANILETTYGVDTRTLVIDFTEGEGMYHKIDKQLQDLEIGILVNNVGISYPHPLYFLDKQENEDLFQHIVNCNIVSVLNMCKIVMPGMVERKKGVIINISSTSAQIPSALLSVYAASKVFVDKLSVDLSQEYSKHGIVIQSQLPGYVATKMSKIKNTSFWIPSPKNYVIEALKTVGVSNRTNGYFPHTLMVHALLSLEYIYPSLFKSVIYSFMLDLRRRALRRK